MATVRSFVNANQMATITCPTCGRSGIKSVDKYRDKKHVHKVRCRRCGNIFTVNLEYRRHYRKPVDLMGYYTMIPPESEGGVTHIKNISQSGVGFTVSGIHSIKKNQTLKIELRLNDKKQTRLKKQVEVKRVDSNFIGCQFLNPAGMDKSLGFFLMR